MYVLFVTNPAVAAKSNKSLLGKALSKSTLKTNQSWVGGSRSMIFIKVVVKGKGGDDSSRVLRK